MITMVIDKINICWFILLGLWWVGKFSRMSLRFLNSLGRHSRVYGRERNWTMRGVWQNSIKSCSSGTRLEFYFIRLIPWPSSGPDYQYFLLTSGWTCGFSLFLTLHSPRFVRIGIWWVDQSERGATFCAYNAILDRDVWGTGECGGVWNCRGYDEDWEWWLSTGCGSMELPGLSWNYYRWM